MTTVSLSRQQQLSPGLAIKTPCRSASTVALVLSGEQTVDGVALVDGDRVLVKNQASSIDNGIYTVSAGSWSRGPDYDGNRDVVCGTTVRVNEGVTTTGYWRISTADPVLIGTSALTFVEDLVGDSSTLSFTQAGSGAVARSGLSKMRDIVSVLDYGLVPNDAGSSAANLAAIKKLVATAANGGDAGFQFRGIVWFPLGADYHIGGIIPFRDGIHLDLGGGTLKFAKADSTAEDAAGFLYTRRDFSCSNGYIEVDYTPTVQNRGNVFKFNARYADTDQGAGQYFLNNFEEDQAPGGTVMPVMPGNIALRNLRIKSNNPKAYMIELIGGLKGVTFDNVFLDGQDLAYGGIDYEFGGATDEALNENEKSSHGRDFHFRNLEIKNLLGAAADGTALGIRGAYNVTVDGLFARNVKTVINFSTGEAANYNPGNEDLVGVKRNNYFRNIVGQGVTLSGIIISGHTAWAGYLSPLAVQSQANVESLTSDLIDATIDGFELSGTTNGNGLNVSGYRINARNGRVVGFSNGVGNNGTHRLSLDNVDVLDSTAAGIRVNDGAGPYATGWSDRQMFVRGGVVAGNTTQGILFETPCNAIIEGVNFGYNNRATGRITVTGGTSSPGVNKISTLTVNGVDILNAAVDWTTSNAATAALIAASINTKISAPDYTAVSNGAEVLIQALAGTGTAPNGFVVARTVGGDFTTGNIKDMSGGKFETAQTNSVRVSSGVSNVVVRNCNTRAVAAGGKAYSNQTTTASNGCILKDNYGDTSIEGAWDADKGSFVGTLTGIAGADPTYTIRYSVKGNIVTLDIPGVGGTSDATTKTITGMPQHLWPVAGFREFMAVASDNGGAQVATYNAVNGGTGVLDFRATIAGAAWTAAGTMLIRSLCISYDRSY